MVNYQDADGRGEIVAPALAARLAQPCTVSDPFTGETTTCAEHLWWHAAGVTRHLVCVGCGLGLHDLSAGEMAAIPHHVLSGAARPEWTVCTGREVAW